MDFLLDLLKGAGIAAGVGIRPGLAAIVAGVLASARLGLDFDRTDYSFLERPWFLVALAAIVIAFEAISRGRPALAWAWLGPALALGAMEAGGAMAARHHPAVVGLLVGTAAAALGYLAARDLFARTARRLDPVAARALPLYGEVAGGIAAGLSIAFAPLALLVIAGLLWLLFGGRRRAGEKYAGLRILR